MKAKILLTIVFLLCFLENASSQEYHPFLNNSWWIVNDFVSCCRQPYVRTINEGTDVLIGSHTYKKFSDPFPQSDWILDPNAATWVTIDTVYIREDVAAKKVYHIVHGNDEILYDFSMEMGDTISQYGFNWAVTAIDAVEVDGGTRKRLTLCITEPHNGHIFTMKWIEGVGSNSHPFYPQHNMYSVESGSGGYNIYTKCSFQNGTHIYGNNEYCGTALSTIDNAYNIQKITFSPNPFATQLTVNAALPLQDATLKLYNIQGQLVREINDLKGIKIILNRENLKSGLYFAQLSEQGKLIKTGKILLD